MAIGKSKDTTPNITNSHNILASGTKLTGEIDSEEDFRIDGSIEGNIKCKGRIIVGQYGSVLGNISGTNVEILGKVIGDILCADTLILRASASAKGNIKMKIIEIESGAQINDSTLSMIKDTSFVQNEDDK